jgi:hypothetical protein
LTPEAAGIIRGQLNALYVQHEAIEAQKLMVNFPESDDGVHPGRADGRAADGDVPDGRTGGAGPPIGHQVRIFECPARLL